MKLLTSVDGLKNKSVVLVDMCYYKASSINKKYGDIQYNHFDIMINPTVKSIGKNGMPKYNTVINM